MKIAFETRKQCPICSTTSQQTLCCIPYENPKLSAFLTDFYSRRIDLNSIAKTDYHVVQCAHCDFIYQMHILDLEGSIALYSEWIDNEASLIKKRTAKSRLFRQYAGQLEALSRIIPRSPHTVEVLEFGMGWGYWSRMAQAFGYKVTGLELAAERVSHARSMGITVIDELPEEGPHYDFIHSNQVFEHLPDPLSTLKQLSARLTDNGVIYLRVPDGRDVKSALAKQGWSKELDAVHPLEHINCFTRKTLCTLASQAELRPFSPPLRVNMVSFRGSVKRELYDRFITTHIYFRRI